MERLAKKADTGAIDAESGMVVFDQKSVIEALSKIDDKSWSAADFQSIYRKLSQAVYRAFG